MSLFDDFSDKQGQQQRHNYASQPDHGFGRHNDHFDKHRDGRGEHVSHASHHRRGAEFSHLTSLVQKLLHNKMLLVLLGFVVVLVLGLVVAALVYMLPLVPKLLGYLDINGLKSLLDQGTAVFEKVLALSGK